MLHLFSRYSSTSDPKKNKPLPHLLIETKESILFDKMLTFMREHDYQNIKTNVDFGDLYGEFKGYEISFQLRSLGDKVELSMSVFGRKKRGVTYTRLCILYDEVEEYLGF